MNGLDWAQVALSLVIMLIGHQIALFRHSGCGVLATTREGGFGVALLGQATSLADSRVLLLRVLCYFSYTSSANVDL
jgi:hypothetical protein